MYAEPISLSHAHTDNKGAISRTEGARNVLLDIARRLKHVPPFRSGGTIYTEGEWFSRMN